MNQYINYKRMAIIMCIALLLPHFLFLKTIKVYANTGKATVTASSLNVRSGPGTTYSKVQVNKSDVFITKDQTVTLLEESGEWFHISTIFNGKTVKGYVKGEFLKIDKPIATPTPTVAPTKAPTVAPTKAPTVAPTKAPAEGNANSTQDDFSLEATVTASSLNVRSKASTTSSRVAGLTKGKKITVTNEVVVDNEKWYRISYKENNKNVTGYVLSNYIELTLSKSMKANVNSTSKVKIRKTASDTGKYVTNSSGTTISLKNNKSITITKEVTDVKGQKWFYISFTVSEVKYKGYILASNVLIRSTNVAPTPTVAPTDVTPKPTEGVTPKPTDGVTPKPTDGVTPKPTEGVTPTPTATPTATPSPTPTPIPVVTSMPEIHSYTEATINSDTIPVYLDIFNGNIQLYDSSYTPIYVYRNTPISIYTTSYIGDMMYYFISFTRDFINYYGFVEAKYTTVNGISVIDVPAVIPTPTPVVGSGVSYEDFEYYLTIEGFPESYKPMLRELHSKYPNWIFEAYHTGLDWDDVIDNESKVGVNLITNAKSLEWKSTEPKAYDWKKDSFVPYDGSTWVTASREGIAYYMDPRNFLDEKGIFQFELLTYKDTYQTAVGVEGILYNTAMYSKEFTYTDKYGNTSTITYADAFIEAAEYSRVSPYHLASRVKQEVVTGATTLSNSVSGTVAGYEGLYNFYNIGAYHSTAPGGAIANGLKYAKNGTTNQENNALFLIPWDNQRDSIVGGAYIIGKNYINRGQDTIYLQKFNVTPVSTYSHQYMANVEAPFAEAKKVYAGYSTMMNSPIVFSIPVFENMPRVASPAPEKAYNPNNWLKTLKVDGHKLTPTFDTSIEQDYYLIVDNSVEFIDISATTVSNKANVIGTGYIALNVGFNEVEVDVIAENGDLRTYTLYVTREE